MTVEQRCKKWDLLVSQCGCPDHRGGKGPDPTEGMVLSGSVIVAKLDGVCALDPDHLIRAGDLIGSVREAGDAVLREAATQWACEKDTRTLSNRRAARGGSLL